VTLVTDPLKQTESYCFADARLKKVSPEVFSHLLFGTDCASSKKEVLPHLLKTKHLIES